MSHITLHRPRLASTWPRGTHAKKPFCLCSKRDVRPGHGRWKWEKVERREGLKRWDVSEAQGLRSKMNSPQSSCLQAKDPSCPSPSTVASVLCHRPHLPFTSPPPRNGRHGFLTILPICNLFYGLKIIIISRNNMHRLSVSKCTFIKCLFFGESLWNCKWVYIWEGGVSGVK